jgi:hypothetical protein
MEVDLRPEAVAVLHRDGDDMVLGPVYAGRCDAVLVERLLRTHLTARRFGWSLELRDVSPRLLELVELVGLRSELVECAAGDAQTMRG